MTGGDSTSPRMWMVNMLRAIAEARSSGEVRLRIAALMGPV
jgi:hypothetical protein